MAKRYSVRYQMAKPKRRTRRGQRGGGLFDSVKETASSVTNSISQGLSGAVKTVSDGFSSPPTQEPRTTDYLSAPVEDLLEQQQNGHRNDGNSPEQQSDGFISKTFNWFGKTGSRQETLEEMMKKMKELSSTLIQERHTVKTDIDKLTALCHEIVNNFETTENGEPPSTTEPAMTEGKNAQGQPENMNDGAPPENMEEGPPETMDEGPPPDSMNNDLNNENMEDTQGLNTNEGYVNTMDQNMVSDSIENENRPIDASSKLFDESSSGSPPSASPSGSPTSESLSDSMLESEKAAATPVEANKIPPTSTFSPREPLQNNDLATSEVSNINDMDSTTINSMEEPPLSGTPPAGSPPAGPPPTVGGRRTRSRRLLRSLRR